MSAIQAMITGTLTKDAEAKVSGGGKEYTALVIRTAGEPAQFVRAAVWGDDASEVLSLVKGDAVSAVGALTVGVWESNGKASPSLSMMAHRAISPALKKSRKSVQHRSHAKPSQTSLKAATEAQSTRTVPNGDGLADDLPWNE
ncbi:MAG: single-stranded DNA-binding protein [Gammaproteobacteria bacterium]|nr:single-stranded DNA-binding protein [Gammaproteobacteria bacterium]MBU1602623.1 single-stranded DNA-binding protein [Gammaproteobacteria bacterium]MBU2433428.1 single-stranded DNA-binding protein [Gammaproteobacteria bacterium]MBU2451344.1 single-stranded DNA-binding protein [Gammaproteobacteria bacterium]